MVCAIGHSISLAPSEPPNSKSSGRDPGSSTGRPIQKLWSAARNSASRPYSPSSSMPKPGRPAATLGGGVDGEALEPADALARRVRFVGDLLELRAMIDRQRHQARRLRAPRRRPMNMVQRLVAPERALGRAVFEEALQLRPGRIFGRTQQARNGEGAAGVGEGAAGLQRLVAQPTPKETRHERVAGAEHVIDLDGEARPLHALLDRVGDGAGKHDAAHRPALEHDRRTR